MRSRMPRSYVRPLEVAVPFALVGAARATYPQVLTEAVRKQPDGQKIMAEYGDALFERWMDYESGRWKPPAQVARTSKTYHGDR